MNRVPRFIIDVEMDKETNKAIYLLKQYLYTDKVPLYGLINEYTTFYLVHDDLSRLEDQFGPMVEENSIHYLRG